MSLLPARSALSHQLVSRALRNGAPQRSCAVSCSRVVFSDGDYYGSWSQLKFSAAILSRLLLRTYATKPARPKPHTGRIAATKRTPAAAKDSTATKKPSAEKTKKPGAKKPKRKTKSKAKAKPTPKPKRKRLTEKQKEVRAKRLAAQKTRDLRKTALLNPPKRLPATAYNVLHLEHDGKGTSLIENSKIASAQYRSLAPAEMERLNHIANENKAKNDAAYKKWLAGFSAMEIREANNARNRLKKQAKKDGKRKHYGHLKDERLVKQARSPYTFFVSDRFASGDMKMMKINEVGGLIGSEWKALSAAERKPFEDQAAADKTRYIQEYTSVYGKAPEPTTRKSTTTTTAKAS